MSARATKAYPIILLSGILPFANVAISTLAASTNIEIIFFIILYCRFINILDKYKL